MRRTNRELRYKTIKHISNNRSPYKPERGRKEFEKVDEIITKKIRLLLDSTN